MARTGLKPPQRDRTDCKARREGRENGLQIVKKKHSKIFHILTGTFGTKSYVGIGFVNPVMNGNRIHNLVFGRAIEYVFFIVEQKTAAISYKKSVGRPVPRPV